VPLKEQIMNTKLWIAVLLAAVTTIASGREQRADAADAPAKTAPKAKAARPGPHAAPRAAPKVVPATSMRVEPGGSKDDNAVLCACGRRRDHA
jgi:hypothetical protein